MPPPPNNNDDSPVDFDLIEGHKENIQALPSGRSAKKLAQLFSPKNPLQPLATPTGLDHKDEFEGVKAEFEREIERIEESDDPLDVWDRYVKWTLEAYPSAQATGESGLVGVLERATRGFVGDKRYRNDGRYVRMWVWYIGWFMDNKREGYVFLSSKGIGEGLAVFYEEYAGWLESVGRWGQAEEVYKLGIEREATPSGRLMRKFGEFEQRRAAQGEERDGPSSPALPEKRRVLGVRADPFAAAAAAASPRDPQAPRPTAGVGGGGGGSKPAKSKLAIFSDADAAPGPSAMSSRGPESKGWDSIGSMADRKKENTMAPKPWAGETLKAGGKKPSAAGAKMAVFRDPSMEKQISQSHIRIDYTKVQVTVNPANGKRERIYVDLRAVYPTPDEPGTEKSFEEIWAANKGWLDVEWEDEQQPNESTLFMNDENSFPGHGNAGAAVGGKGQKMAVHADVIRLDENGAPIYPNSVDKPKKKKKQELNETQIIQTKLDSPSGPKIKKKKRQSVGEPTMTLHTKAATDDIYDIFNASVKPVKPLGEDSDDEGGYESDDYTMGGDGTTRNITTSDVDEDEDDEVEDDVGGDGDDNASQWSESSHKHHQDQSDDLIDVHDGEEDDHPDEPPRTRTMFVPIPPEDYVPTRRPWRDPVEAANNRLPFMTPITERTEMSLDVTADMGRYELHSKTPSRQINRNMIAEENEEDDEEEEDLTPLSSPVRDVMDDENGFPKGKVSQPLLPKPRPALATKPLAMKALTPKALTPKPIKTLTINNKGPIIKDAQCNPVDNAVRAEILSNITPPLTSYQGFYDRRNEKSNRGVEIRKYCKAISKGGNRSSTGDRSSDLGPSVVLRFPDTEREYTIRRELGAGAFAPVYLVNNSKPSGTDHSEDENDENENAIMGKGRFASAHHKRYPQEALKMESPPTPWEFYIMRLAHSRLGPHDRATASLSPALEFHLFQDECFLFLPFHPFGTLLDVVNLFRGEASGVMDEQLAMFFTIELLRTVEALHSKGIMHGDLKADNCLLRLPPVPDTPLSNKYQPDGSHGWASRGITLIDFGRGIDMRAFRDDVQFVADWKTTSQDCNEVREGRLWTWQIEYFGLAGIVHCLLFGKYIDTVGVRGENGLGKRYRIRESLKRYWQTEIWGGLFEMLLNPGDFKGEEEGGRMPLVKGLRGYRERMEGWLVMNGERGVGVRGGLGRVEGWARGRR
ncbi:putative checkpoint serine/threonine-protein kinase [Triangularia verruculosa]|uniref:Checkpoint serine/threonine-protein kinase n=1 Tax=Triangularia verruculosa TaxID=2587418 RepID=A0AAN7AZG9_9PEZI|nr:putative checkpoint serine/threonine-protein kinase [Triangularia verruculosa]